MVAAHIKLFWSKMYLRMLRAYGKFWQLHYEAISRDDFSEAPNEVHHQKNKPSKLTPLANSPYE
jgi:hypothetical protein